MNWTAFLLKVILHFDEADKMAVGEEDSDRILTNGRNGSKWQVDITLKRIK